MTNWWISVRRFFTANRYMRIIAATGLAWSDEHVSRLSASLSFYALLSLIPLLVTCHALFGLIMDEHVLSHGMDAQIASLIGKEQAAAVRSMLEHAQSPSFASLKAVVGSLLTFITAAGVFIDLKDSMDAVWKAPKRGRGGLLRFMRNYFAPLSMVLGFGFLMLISLFLNAVVMAAATSISVHQTGLLAMIATGNEIISFAISLCLIASILRFLPSATIAWRDVWLGSLLTSLLFMIGRILIGIYLGTSNFTGQYGSAGAVVAIVIWIYYSAQILFIGALFTREHASIMAFGHTTFEESQAGLKTAVSTTSSS
jgi:membrane protein